MRHSWPQTRPPPTHIILTCHFIIVSVCSVLTLSPCRGLGLPGEWLLWSGVLSKGLCSGLGGADRASRHRVCWWGEGDRGAQVMAPSTHFRRFRETCRPELLVSRGREASLPEAGRQGMGGGGGWGMLPPKVGTAGKTDSKRARWTGAGALAPSPCTVVYSHKF